SNVAILCYSHKKYRSPNTEILKKNPGKEKKLTTNEENSNEQNNK
ncbi:hypothetical protein DOY81_004623, partial [Sarcophaga bullata]